MVKIPHLWVRYGRVSSGEAISSRCIPSAKGAREGLPAPVFGVTQTNWSYPESGDSVGVIPFPHSRETGSGGTRAPTQISEHDCMRLTRELAHFLPESSKEKADTLSVPTFSLCVFCFNRQPIPHYCMASNLRHIIKL